LSPSSLDGARVIVVAPRLWPTWGAGTQRTTALVTGLVEAGAKVSALVATAQTHYGERPSAIGAVDLHIVNHPWTRLPWKVHHGAMVVGGRDPLAPAHRRLAHVASTIPADLVVTSGPPWSAVELAARLARERNIPLAADLRDEWSANPFQRWLGPMYHALTARRETRALAGARLITAPFSAVIDTLRAPPNCPALVLRHGCDTRLILDLVPSPPPLAPDEAIRLLFAGARYGKLNEARLLAVAARATRPLPRVHLQLVGASRPLTVDPPPGFTVEIIPPVSHEALMAYYAQAHALLTFGPRERGPGCIPSKLEEYWATGRPVVAFTDPTGDLWGLVGSVAGGSVVDENDPNALRAGLVALRQICESATDFRPQRVLRDWRDVGREYAAAVAAHLGPTARRT
jgi:glycosyltransferase involved in cell wall biosynthesis